MGQARVFPKYTQIVPNWHLAGQLAGTLFFLNTHTAQRTKKNSVARSKIGLIRLA